MLNNSHTMLKTKNIPVAERINFPAVIATLIPGKNSVVATSKQVQSLRVAALKEDKAIISTQIKEGDEDYEKGKTQFRVALSTQPPVRKGPKAASELTRESSTVRVGAVRKPAAKKAAAKKAPAKKATAFKPKRNVFKEPAPAANETP
jgi:hypothetical protein